MLKVNGKGELVWCSSLVCPYIERLEWRRLCWSAIGVGALGIGTKICVLAITDPYTPLLNVIDGLWVIVAGCYLFWKNARGAYEFIYGGLKRFKRYIGHEKR